MPLQIKRLLKSTFGHEALRAGQEEVIRLVLAGRDVLAIMPTGAGKSLCYQLPALHLEGTTIVVSPLIALIKDQMDKLVETGARVLELNSTLSDKEAELCQTELSGGKVDFLFVTPERLTDPTLRKVLAKIKIDLFVIDEAHCVSQWGHDFRPAYLEIQEAVKALGRPQILALTATATPEVAQDIRDQLGLKELDVVHTGVYRKNLRLNARVTNDEAEKLQALIDEIEKSEGLGIIYAATVKNVELLTDALRDRGIEARAYHGKLPAKERTEVQNDFMASRLKVVVATNAFGLGIDKPDIRFVMHYNFPATLEAYYQEAGRAGRDGLVANCTLFYLKKDKSTQSFFLAGRYPTITDLKKVLEFLAKSGGKAKFEELAFEVEVAKSKLRVIWNMLKEESLISPNRGGAVTVARSDLSEAECSGLMNRYIERAESDQQKLKRMIIYAQSALCRWSALLDYFGEEKEWARCGHCDCCDHPVEISPAA